ncbi:MAG: molybdenum ABC transporter permease [Candidatus Bathyarchaeum sp.]|nr:MAG: molybdenum ABC transporter permease [Candidatus Bathyarchaeum sp.]
MVWLKEKSPFIVASFVLGATLVLFLVVPIFSALGSSASGMLDVLMDGRTLNSIWMSFYCAFLATGFMFVLGVPFAYLFVRNTFPGKNVLDSLIDVPILIPHNTAGIALLFVFRPDNPIGAAFSMLGISFVDTVWGIVIAMAFVSAPFMVRSAQEAFMSIDPEMEKIGRSLGATRFKVFANITFPLASRGILTGCLLTWARAVSEFGAVVLIAYFPKTAPVHLYDVFVSQGLTAALPINGLLILLAIIILVVFRVTVAKPTKPVYRS